MRKKKKEKRKGINSPSLRHHLLPLSHNLLALMQTNCKEARQMLIVYLLRFAVTFTAEVILEYGKH